MACLMSPSEINNNALRALSEIFTFSAFIILSRFFSTSSYLSLLNRRMMHLLWMGSMSLEEMLQLRTNRVVSEKLDIIILRACCAPSVKLSASSRIIILVISLGRLSCFWANVLIWSLTTSIPLSSEALSSFTAFLYYSPNSSFTMHSTLDVLPVPGGPDKIRWGM